MKSKIRSRKNKIYYYFVLIVFIIFAIFTIFKPEEKYNVILISIDTLRADHLGSYEYFRNTSPNIDKLAIEGFLFKNTFSQAPWTLPSHASIFTSKYPTYHGVINERNIICDITLTEVLKNNGYETIAYASKFGFVKGKFGFNRGFKEYTDINNLLRNNIQSAIEWLDNKRNGPFFLFLYGYDVHDPYLIPNRTEMRFDVDRKTNIPVTYEDLNKIIEEELQKSIYKLNESDIPVVRKIYWKHINQSSVEDKAIVKSMYDNKIALVDYHLGFLFNKLKELGIFDKTIIIITSDHGEEFWEHGGYKP